MKMKELSSSINYSDTAECSAWEKKWGVAQAIWSAYHAANKPDDELYIPKTTLEINGRRKAQIIDILKGLEKAGCFIYSHPGSENYLVRNIKHSRFKKVYHDIGNTYKKFAEIYQEGVGHEEAKTNNIKETQNKQPKTLIERLEVVSQNNNNRFSVIVNNNYQKPIECDRAKLCWDVLYKIATKEQSLNAREHKSSIEYLNTNKLCRIYKQTGCSITKILESKGGFVTAAIPITTITKRKFTQGKNASRKTT